MKGHDERTESPAFRHVGTEFIAHYYLRHVQRNALAFLFDFNSTIPTPSYRIRNVEIKSTCFLLWEERHAITRLCTAVRMGVLFSRSPSSIIRIGDVCDTPWSQRQTLPRTPSSTAVTLRENRTLPNSCSPYLLDRETIVRTCIVATALRCCRWHFPGHFAVLKFYLRCRKGMKRWRQDSFQVGTIAFSSSPFFSS